MKKSQKWLLILMMTVFPIIIMAVAFIISSISIKEIPWWATIVIAIVICVSPFIFLFAQRFAQRIEHDATLQKKRKRFLIVLGLYTIVLAIILTITYLFNYQFFWWFLFIQAPLWFFILFIGYSFQKKEKKSTEVDNQNSSTI